MFDGMTVGEIREQARRDADAVRSEYWADGSIPVDPIEIARNFGTVFEAQLGTDTYGMVIGSPSGADIYVDQDDPPARKRFTIAHELGHIVAHSGNLNTELESFTEIRSEAGSGTAPEIHANEFAGELLMPKTELTLMIRSGRNNYEMADAFQVSVPALAYRRRVLGI